MRDKVVVIRLQPEALAPPESIEKMASQLTLLRALDLRLIIVVASDGDDSFSAATRAQLSALTLAISRQGQKAVPLQANSVIAVHKLAIPDSAPKYLPVVDQVMLTQLCTLRYIPMLLMPITDADGAALPIPSDEIVAAVGKFMEAARTFVNTPETPDGLFADLFLR